jgi:hypothetical protein
MLMGFKLEAIAGPVNVPEKLGIFFVGKTNRHNSAGMVTLQNNKQGVFVTLCFGHVHQR